MVAAALTVESLLIENRDLRQQLEELRKQLQELSNPAAQALDKFSTFVPKSELPRLTGVPMAEINRLIRSGRLRGYPCTQKKKKRLLFNPYEVAAAIKQEAQPAKRLGFDVGKLFERHNIPSSRALSGVRA